MAIVLMTTTGTQENVDKALGIAPGVVNTPDPLFTGSAEGSVEALPSEAVTPTEPTPPASAEAPPAVPESPPEPAPAPETTTPADDQIPDTEFDEDGEPLTERASRSSRTKLQTIKKLRVRAREAETRAARLEGELSVLRTPPSPAPATPAPVPIPTEAAPTEDQFETYEAYIRALSRYETRQSVTAALAEERQRVQAEKVQAAEASALQIVRSRIETFRQAHADYDDTINDPAIKINDAMKMILTDPDNSQGPALAYALGKDPARCARIAALPPAKAILEMGMLQAEIVREAAPAPPATPAPPKPAAPPPPTPVRGGSAPATLSLDQLAKAGRIHDFIARRNEEERQERMR